MRYQINLPVRFNTGERIPESIRQRWLDQLEMLFGGLTTYGAFGRWQGHNEPMEVVEAYTLTTDTTDPLALKRGLEDVAADVAREGEQAGVFVAIGERAFIVTDPYKAEE